MVLWGTHARPAPPAVRDQHVPAAHTSMLQEKVPASSRRRYQQAPGDGISKLQGMVSACSRRHQHAPIGTNILMREPSACCMKDTTMSHEEASLCWMRYQHTEWATAYCTGRCQLAPGGIKKTVRTTTLLLEYAPVCCRRRRQYVTGDTGTLRELPECCRNSFIIQLDAYTGNEKLNSKCNM